MHNSLSYIGKKYSAINLIYLTNQEAHTTKQDHIIEAANKRDEKLTQQTVTKHQGLN